MAKKKIAKTDGLGLHEKRKLRAAIRQVWHRSYARRLVVDRCMSDDGFPRCEGKNCKLKGRPAPKITVDHIQRVGEVDSGFIDRMFVPSKKLRGLCEECHKEKTREENKKAAALKRAADAEKDFY